MNKQIAMDWVAALRSGEYEQCTERLRENTPNGDASFCCLGVLCNLHAQAHPEIAITQTDRTSYLSTTSTLPHQVRKWAGAKNDIGAPKNNNNLVINSRKHGSLAEANDDGEKFEDIANWIEKNYEKL